MLHRTNPDLISAQENVTAEQVGVADFESFYQFIATCVHSSRGDYLALAKSLEKNYLFYINMLVNGQSNSSRNNILQTQLKILLSKQYFKGSLREDIILYILEDVKAEGALLKNLLTISQDDLHCFKQRLEDMQDIVIAQTRKLQLSLMPLTHTGGYFSHINEAPKPIPDQDDLYMAIQVDVSKAWVLQAQVAYQAGDNTCAYSILNKALLVLKQLFIEYPHRKEKFALIPTIQRIMIQTLNTRRKNFEVVMKYKEAIIDLHLILELLYDLKNDYLQSGDDEIIQMKLSLAKVTSDYGLFFFKQQQYPFADIYFKRAVDMLEKIHAEQPEIDLSSQLKIYRNIGRIYKETGNYDSAIKYFQFSISLSNKQESDNTILLQSMRDLCAILNAQALHLSEEKKYLAAIKKLHEAISYLQEVVESGSHSKMGSLEAKLMEQDKVVLKNFQRNVAGLFNAYAITRYNCKDYRSAIQYLQMACEELSKVNSVMSEEDAVSLKIFNTNLASAKHLLLKQNSSSTQTKINEQANKLFGSTTLSTSQTLFSPQTVTGAINDKSPAKFFQQLTSLLNAKNDANNHDARSKIKEEINVIWFSHDDNAKKLYRIKIFILEKYLALTPTFFLAKMPRVNDLQTELRNFIRIEMPEVDLKKLDKEKRISFETYQLLKPSTHSHNFKNTPLTIGFNHAHNPH